MAEFQVKTKDNADVPGKPRVYFCCHPEDFDKYFNKICEDIFKTHTPAIYYTFDMTEPLDDTNINVDLERVNLFVIPVTFKLMNEPNRAMQVDIAYAKEKNIPILPFVMESGSEMDVLYSLERNFGTMQYISPFSDDITEISYEEKLKKYLEATLISDEMAQRIKAAFDAYIFLSYRKKDRAYANSLIKLIHNIPNCQNIAIWYDEFLVPGESFIQNIEQAIQKSRLFTLLVTPNLLEDGNFVMTEEYPAAKKAGKYILPTEMEETDYELLKSKFHEIPNPLKANDGQFTDTLRSVINKIATSKSDTDPEHNFLIGLAYLDGIDVEVNVERGLSLIKNAAENGLREAMNKLVDMYTYGYKVAADYHEALYWGKYLYSTFLAVGYSSYTTEEWLSARHKFAQTLYLVGQYERSLSVWEKLYRDLCHYSGENHPSSIDALHNHAACCDKLGQKEKAIELYQKVYETKCQLHGEENPQTYIVLSNLANIYADIGNYTKALELFEKAYRFQCMILETDHPHISFSLGFIAGMHEKLGDYPKALGFHIEAYEMRKKILGEENIYTIHALYKLAGTYVKTTEYHKAINLYLQAYDLYCKVIGEKHRDTLLCLNNVGYCYTTLDDYKTATEYFEKAYSLFFDTFGEDDKDTVSALYNLIYSYTQIGENKKAIEAQKKYYNYVVRTTGSESPQSMSMLNRLADFYYKAKEYTNSIDTYERLYALFKKVYGEDSEYAMNTLFMMSRPYFSLGNVRKAVELTEQAYVWCLNAHGEDHSTTLARKADLEFLRSKLT